ncbi:hypothetical protein H5410_004515 [Solanum commersonii]|uniref:Uncharacterized protein n=1 Tax=Solanum commersonii TaxID=4109 RepID=A0A9J6B7X7_SOLCO|nr:hypothetical protein H5410_004515 [Solanum commersonii]
MSPTCPPSPILASTFVEPFTPSPSPSLLDCPNHNHHIFPPPPLIETLIPSTTINVSSSSPNHPHDTDLDDVFLSILHPQYPSVLENILQLRSCHFGFHLLAVQGILPRGHKWHEASFCDMRLSHILETKDPINWPSLMIQHMTRIMGPQPGSYQLSYGNLLPIVFKEFTVPLGEGRVLMQTCLLVLLLRSVGSLLILLRSLLHLHGLLDLLLVCFEISRLQETSVLLSRMKMHPCGNNLVAMLEWTKSSSYLPLQPALETQKETTDNEKVESNKETINKEKVKSKKETIKEEVVYEKDL